MKKRNATLNLTFLDLASLGQVSGGAPAGLPEGPVDSIGPRVREETGPDGEPVLVYTYY